jgi:hypothetical protein
VLLKKFERHRSDCFFGGGYRLVWKSLFEVVVRIVHHHQAGVQAGVKIRGQHSFGLLSP